MALCRITAMLPWSVFCALLTIPVHIQGGWSAARNVSHITRLWASGIAGIAGLRVTVSGSTNAARSGLLVSNHLSYLDVLAHASLLPIRFTPKKDIAEWPILGWYIGLSRPIWIDRRNKSGSADLLKEFAETMKHGMNLIVYPEGTTSDGKHGIMPFKSTPFEAAVAGGYPVIPMLIRYREREGKPTACWYGDMTLLPHVWKILKSVVTEADVAILPPVDPSGKSRKELSSEVHEIMSREYRRGG